MKQDHVLNRIKGVRPLTMRAKYLLEQLEVLYRESELKAVVARNSISSTV